MTLIGSEPHPPYQRPPLSKSAITAEDQPSPKTIATEERLAAASIELMIGNPAVRIDRQKKMVELADGTSVPYGKLLLATGAVPRRLPQAPGSALYLRTFEDALFIRSRLRAGCRVAIVGGGFIGIELAASARTRGAAVRSSKRGHTSHHGVPEAIALSVEARHVVEGVDVLCGHGIAAIEQGGSSFCIRTMRGQHLEADLCVVGIGAVPATGLAKAAGLRVDNGVAVDECLRTSDPDIFAAGDCCSVPLGIYNRRRIRLEAWRNAQEQGTLAAMNMLGGDQRKRPCRGSGPISMR